MTFRSFALALVVFVLAFAASPERARPLAAASAHASDDIDDGGIVLSMLGRASIVGATSTIFLALGAGGGFALAYFGCPTFQCPRYHPGERPTPDAPIDPMMLGAGAAMGAALGFGLGAYLSGAVVTLALE